MIDVILIHPKRCRFVFLIDRINKATEFIINTFMSKKTMNPFNNQIELTFEDTSPEVFERAISKAEIRNDTWKHSSLEEKAILLEKVANLMQNKKDQLSIFLKLEMGKLLAQNYTEMA